MKLSFPDIISILIIFQGLFFALFLGSHKQRDKQNNVFLGLISACLSLHFLNMYLLKVYAHYPNFGPVFGLLYGPLFFHYTQSLVLKKASKLLQKKGAHYIPAGLVFLFILFSTTKATKVYSIFINWATLPILIHLFCYLVFTYLLISRYHAALKNYASSLDKIKLSWLQFIIFSMFLVPIFVLLEYYLSFTLFENYRSFSESLIYLFVFFLMSSFIYKGLSHPELFSGIPDVDTLAKKAKVPPAHSPRLLEKLSAYMEEEKPFLEPKLSLDELASKLGIPSRQLSSLINREIGQNFFEYIHAYRIEEAKKLLSNPENKRNRINEVMLDAGFNSKSSFNEIFKKHTGITPSQFKKQANNRLI